MAGGHPCLATLTPAELATEPGGASGLCEPGRTLLQFLPVACCLPAGPSSRQPPRSPAGCQLPLCSLPLLGPRPALPLDLEAGDSLNPRAAAALGAAVTQQGALWSTELSAGWPPLTSVLGSPNWASPGEDATWKSRGGTCLSSDPRPLMHSGCQGETYSTMGFWEGPGKKAAVGWGEQGDSRQRLASREGLQ